MKYDSTTLLQEKSYEALTPAERHWADAEFGGREGYAQAAAALQLASSHVQAASLPPANGAGWAGVAAAVSGQTPWWKRPVPVYQTAAAAALLLLLGWWWGQAQQTEALPQVEYVTVVDTLERLERVRDTIYMVASPEMGADEAAENGKTFPQRMAVSQQPGDPKVGRQVPRPKTVKQAQRISYQVQEPGFLPAVGAGQGSGVPGKNLASLRSELEAEFGGVTSELQVFGP